MADLNQYIEQIQNFDVNNIDWDKIGIWPLPAKILICVLAFIAIMVACHFVIVKEKVQMLASEEAQEVTLKSSFETKAYEAANLDRYRRQMQEMSGTLQALVSRLPSSIELPGLIEDIDEKIYEARLEMDSITPLREVATEFHIERPIRINVVGGYHEFGAFVSGIAGMPRIVTLHDFSIIRQRGSNILAMEIMAQTYRYKAEEE